MNSRSADTGLGESLLGRGALQLQNNVVKLHTTALGLDVIDAESSLSAARGE